MPSNEDIHWGPIRVQEEEIRRIRAMVDRWAAEYDLPPVEPVPAWWTWTPPLPGEQAT